MPQKTFAYVPARNDDEAAVLIGIYEPTDIFASRKAWIELCGILNTDDYGYTFEDIEMTDVELYEELCDVPSGSTIFWHDRALFEDEGVTYRYAVAVTYRAEGRGGVSGTAGELH